MLPSGMEEGGGGPSLFFPRVWVITKKEKGVVKFKTREHFVDAKLASAHLLTAIKKGEVVHFDEAIVAVRKPKDLVIFYVGLRDETSGKEVEIELTGIPDEGVEEFVAGLNKFEEILVTQAMQVLQKE